MKSSLSLIIIIVSSFIILTGCNGEVSDEKTYYGEWITTNSVYYAPISAVTEDQYNEEYLGKVASYSKEEAKFHENININPAYQEKILNNDAFYEEFRVNLQDLGITEKEVLIVDIRDWNSPCSLLIVKD